jgi:hypothetical protein
MQLPTNTFDIVELFLTKAMILFWIFNWKKFNFAATETNHCAWKYVGSQLDGSVLTAHGGHLFTPWHWDSYSGMAYMKQDEGRNGSHFLKP